MFLTVTEAKALLARPLLFRLPNVRKCSSKSSENEGSHVVAVAEAKRFMMDCMIAAGAEQGHSNQLADVLVAADYRGHLSHGLNRLDMYAKDVKTRVCRGSGNPIILKEKGATGWVDGNNLLGPVVGNFCMDLAIKKSHEYGIGWVVCKGSNHYGIAGWYALRACAQGLLGMSFTNTSPLVFPTRSKMVALGTNPLSLAAPAKNGDHFYLDMATTNVAIGKVELADRKGAQLGRGWAADASGKETLNPKHVIPDGGLLPLGGLEKTSGYKGYGLGMLVEIFCGILGGAQWGPKIRKWRNATTAADLGQCFIAIDPDCFAPQFGDRLQAMINTFRLLTPVNADPTVLVAGDPERSHMKKCDDIGGIPYHQKQIAYAETLALQFGIKPMRMENVKQ